MFDVIQANRPNLIGIFRAGFVRRWHSNPDLAGTVDEIHGHAGRVARLILVLHPDPSRDLLAAALQHDDGEVVTGDMPGDFKAANPDITARLSCAEDVARRDLWVSVAVDGLRPDDLMWLRFCDRLDAWLWVLWHAPDVLLRGDWSEVCVDLRDCACGLGVLAAVDDVLTPPARRARRGGA